MLKFAIFSSLFGAIWAQDYQDLITHNNLDYFKCRDSYQCGYDELCERVCFWQEKYQKFVGCKVTCVKKGGYDHPHGYQYKILPLPAPVPQPDYHPPPPAPDYHPPPPAPDYHPPPTYPPPPPPRYAPPPPPPVYGPDPYEPPHPAPHDDIKGGQSYHNQVCYNDYECGYNRVCNKYEKTCECKYGFEPDPDYHDRCIDTQPQYQPPVPDPYRPPPPPPKYETPSKGYRACHSASDCYYGEKCCFWKKCNSYGNCATAYKCANYCH